MEFVYSRDGETHVVTVERRGDHFRVRVDGRGHEAILRRVAGIRIDLVVDGREVAAVVVRDGARRVVRLGEADPVEFERGGRGLPAARPDPGGGDGVLTAGMDGRVAAILVREGDRVETGATLLVLEAMKMELRVTAPRPGLVREIACAVGDVVERGRVLARVETEAVPERGTPEPAGRSRPGARPRTGG
jgi:3-methylcrotonyl-CoA carboxylase alpha subunit